MHYLMNQMKCLTVSSSDQLTTSSHAWFRATSHSIFPNMDIIQLFKKALHVHAYEAWHDLLCSKYDVILRITYASRA